MDLLSSSSSLSLVHSKFKTSFLFVDRLALCVDSSICGSFFVEENTKSSAYNSYPNMDVKTMEKYEVRLRSFGYFLKVVNFNYSEIKVNHAIYVDLLRVIK